jgi:chromosome segregation ATPase
VTTITSLALFLPSFSHHLSAGGKSAILTGIVVALGGKARSTERGSSLKQFIKTGEKMAEVTVTLRNRGSESYRPEEYGDSITIVRQIKDDGTGSYKIKGEKGEGEVDLAGATSSAENQYCIY